MEKFDSFLDYQTWSYHRAQKFCSWLYTQEKHMHLSVQTHTHMLTAAKCLLFTTQKSETSPIFIFKS